MKPSTAVQITSAILAISTGLSVTAFILSVWALVR